MIAELLAGTTKILTPARAKANPTLPSLVVGRTQGTQGIPPEDQDFQAYLEAHGLFPWVSSCVDAISLAGASVDRKVMRRTPRGLEELDEHPLLELLRNPNPEEGGFAFWYGRLQHIGYTGEAFFTSDAPFSDRTSELWGQRPDRMRPVVDAARHRPGKEESPLSHWIYKNDAAKDVTLDVDEVVQVKRPNPKDPFRGLSPIKQLEALLKLEFKAVQWNGAFFDNGAGPGLHIGRENAPTEKEIERFREQFEERYKGVKNAMRTLFTWGKGVTVEKIGGTPSDASFLELLEYIKAAILSVYNCPPFVVALPDGTTWANSREQKAFFYANAVIPWNKLITDTLNSSPIVRAHGPDIYIAHDYSTIEALQPDAAAQAERDTKLVTAGIRTINEIREDREYGEPVEWGDEPMQANPLAGLFGGQKSATVPATPNRRAVRQCCSPGGVRLAITKARASGNTKRLAWAEAVENMSERWPAWETTLAKLWDGMEREVLANFRARERVGLSRKADEETIGPLVPAGWASDAWFDEVATAEKWEAELLALGGVDLEAGAAGVASLIEGVGFEPAFDLADEGVQAFLKEHTAQKVTQMLSTDKDLIAGLVESAAAEGHPVSELAAQIKDHFEWDRTVRATRIAQTEVTALYGEGSVATMEQSGLERHTWQTSGLENVRAAHRAVNQTTVGIRENFTMTGPKGEQASGPGPGRMGAGWADVNCVCITIPAP